MRSAVHAIQYWLPLPGAKPNEFAWGEMTHYQDVEYFPSLRTDGGPWPGPEYDERGNETEDLGLGDVWRLVWRRWLQKRSGWRWFGLRMLSVTCFHGREDCMGCD